MPNDYKYKLTYSPDKNGRLQAYVYPDFKGDIANVSAMEAFYNEKTMGKCDTQKIKISRYLPDTVCPQLWRIAGLNNDAITAAIKNSEVDKTNNAERNV